LSLPLSAPLRVSEALQKKLDKLGLHTQADLLLHLPLRYEDETCLTPIAAALDGDPVQLEATVRRCDVQTAPRKQMQVLVQDDAGDSLTLRFLNFYASQQAMLTPGTRLRLFGEVRDGFFGAEMVHPRFRLVDAGMPLPTTFTPVYPTTAGLAQSALQKLTARALREVRLDDDLLAGFLPPKLPDIGTALRTLHAPPVGTSLNSLQARTHPAWQRIKFDEILSQQLCLRRAYLARRALTAPVLPKKQQLTQQLLAALPFALTGAQARAMAEIAHDLAQGHPMQRLLQGDVGSGKTIVAALAACQAMAAGWQAAFMAPTEILAEQHYLKLKSWLEPLGIKVAWLTGSLKTKAKRAQLASLKAEANLIVGTHALIQEGVDYSRLGLVIIDEQHRFGVQQRLALRQKGEVRADVADPAQKSLAPHQLMMSATPIPRTLAMTYFADLDVSVLDELPPGRTPIRTQLIQSARRDEVTGFVRQLVAQGRQVYWVCPLIEESETLQLQTALETWELLCAELPELAVGLVHGRLKPDEKQATMTAFAAGEIHLLVATTVIEVGVDVPNASLMVIEHAERFGLSQLHQLRGRVGRGPYESRCILLYAQPLSATARQRLKIIYENTNGFEIARQDLELRGPGEFVGSRQSGVPMLRYANLDTDAHLIEQAQQLAETLLTQHPARAEAHLQRWLAGREALLKT
jgi:ATP-dependent DNA helicase RecG